MQNILCLSYGKNSIACLGAIEQLGWALDRIVHVEIWATESIPADLPPMVAFKEKADKIIKERWGIEVEHIRSRDTYEDCFYRVCGNCGRASTSKRSGSIYGWPYQRGPWCNSRLKQHTLEKLPKDARQYIGIAVDEPDRFHVLGENKISPLIEAGWTDRDCRVFVEQNGLLAPTYTTSTRGGCWFCHNQNTDQLRILRRTYPELWAIMLKWDKDSPVTFKAGCKNKKTGIYKPGKTLNDYELRFQYEDSGRIDPNKKFYWKQIEADQTQQTS